ncbi:MAG: TIGR04283 family arsenosugar biosynthesis glycosyltransferase [Stenomitos frigidus ULC029]
MSSHISIIIPTLNEATTLERTLRHLSILEPPPWEILVVDGGSQDQTVAIAQAGAASVIFSQNVGRSVQMNQGAAAATGDVLCFLHADTLVPDDLVAIIDRTLTNPAIVAGGFVSMMTGTTTTWWLLALLNVVKTYLMPFAFRPWQYIKGFRLLFGDQVIFCRRQAFCDCSGFDPALPIMEEADLCLKLMPYGRICQINRTVECSDRRLVKQGALKATATYIGISCLWGIGVSATTLKRFYQEIR